MMLEIFQLLPQLVAGLANFNHLKDFVRPHYIRGVLAVLVLAAERVARVFITDHARNFHKTHFARNMQGRIAFFIL
jgi:hypothetical protein